MSEKRPQRRRDAGLLTRRTFLRTSAAAGAAALAAGLPGGAVFAAGDSIKIGLVGCGNRGIAAARDALRSASGVEIVALADAIPAQLAAAADALGVRADRRFAGFGAYRDLLALADVNLVIIASPPAFRPVQLAAAVESGKNVHVEPPVAICPAGYRMVVDVAAKAKEKGVAVGVGLQRRHDPATVETMKRVADGAIGTIITGQCYWNQGAVKAAVRVIGQGDVEWQLRNWRHFVWLSGDHVVERHVHNLDIIGWAIGSPPERFHHPGGRQYRTSPDYGNVYDHFGTEIFYPNDLHVISMCRQIDGTEIRVGERIVGTSGITDCRGRIDGATPWTYEGRAANPFVKQFADLIAGIRAGTPPNEAAYAAESALTAVMARESAYTRTNFKRSWFLAKSTQSLLPPEDLSLEQRKVVVPVAIPGVYAIPGTGEPSKG